MLDSKSSMASRRQEISTKDCPFAPGCPAIASVKQELADKWIAEYQDHSVKLAEFGVKLAEADALIRGFIPQIKHAIEVATVAAAMLPVLKKTDENTIAETVKAKAKVAEHEERLNLHEKHLAEAREAGADAGAKAGSIAAVKLVKAKTRLYLAAAGVLVILGGVLPAAVQSCASRVSAASAASVAR